MGREEPLRWISRQSVEISSSVQRDVGKSSRTYAAMHVFGVALFPILSRAHPAIQLVTETFPAPGKTVEPHCFPS